MSFLLTFSRGDNLMSKQTNIETAIGTIILMGLSFWAGLAIAPHRPKPSTSCTSIFDTKAADTFVQEHTKFELSRRIALLKKKMQVKFEGLKLISIKF